MKSRPRLCFVVTSAVTATTFMQGYLRFLREAGWEVYLICSDGPGLDALANSDGVCIRRIEMKREPSPINDIRSLVKMCLLIRRLNPDVLVYATPKASLLASVAGLLTRVPRRVYELWGLRLETSTGIRRTIFHVLEWITAKLSSVVIANSRSLAERSQKLGVNAGKEVLVLGAGSSHGVDSKRFDRNADMPQLDELTATALARSKVPVVGFIGRLHPDKGVDILIDALQICANQGIAMQGLIVGGDEGANLMGRVDILRNTMPVQLVGNVVDIRPYLSRMDVLVLPSLREGFPNVVIEAASMGIPAIVSDATGCIDAVQNQVTGRIVPVGDVNALADVLATIPADSDWRAMGKAASDYVRQNFLPEDIWKLHSEAFARELFPPSKLAKND